MSGSLDFDHGLVVLHIDFIIKILLVDFGKGNQ